MTNVTPPLLSPKYLHPQGHPRRLDTKSRSHGETFLFSFPDHFILELKEKKKERERESARFFPPLSFWDIQIKMTPLSKFLMRLLELHKGRQMMEGRGGWRGGVPELIRDCSKWILYNWVIFLPSIVFHSDGQHLTGRWRLFRIFFCVVANSPRLCLVICKHTLPLRPLHKTS